jgi:multidrug efflux pump subunit AcrA (membrane-fusion protein)
MKTGLLYALIPFTMALIAFAGCKKHDETHEHTAACTHDAPAETAEAHAHSAACTHDEKPAAQKPADDHDHEAKDDAHDHAAPAQPDADGHEHQPGERCGSAERVTVTLPPSAQKLINITFATAEVRHVQATRRFAGRFEMKPDARRIYSTLLEGTLELLVTPNQRVEKGTPLFRLQSPAWIRLQGELRTAEITAQRLETETRLLRERLQRLKEANTRNAELEMALPLKEADCEQAHATRDHLYAQRAMITSQMQAKDHALVVVAQESGIVDAILTTTGQCVQPSTEILSVARTSGIWFKAECVVSETLDITPNLRGFVEPLKTESGTTKPRAEGTVTLAWSTDMTQRTRDLFLTLDRVPEWAIPGLPGVMNVVLANSTTNSIVVPAAAMIQDGLEQVVFAREDHDPNVFTRVVVIPGASDGAYTEVSAIQAGDTVVVNGVYELKLAAPSSGKSTKRAAGHFHADGKFHEGKH